MDIKIGKFTAVSSGERFNLVETKRTRVKDGDNFTGETRETQVELGYDMSLPAILQHIVNRNLNDQNKVVSLSEYIALYKAEVAKLKEILN
jgi:hypothetical protein